MGQGIISRSNPGNTGDKVGDIRITTRNTLGDKWALCNGTVYEGECAIPKNPLNENSWKDLDVDFSSSDFSFGKLSLSYHSGGMTFVDIVKGEKGYYLLYKWEDTEWQYSGDSIYKIVQLTFDSNGNPRYYTFPPEFHFEIGPMYNQSQLILNDSDNIVQILVYDVICYHAIYDMSTGAKLKSYTTPMDYTEGGFFTICGYTKNRIFITRTGPIFDTPEIDGAYLYECNENGITLLTFDNSNIGYFEFKEYLCDYCADTSCIMVAPYSGGSNYYKFITENSRQDCNNRNGVGGFIFDKYFIYDMIAVDLSNNTSYTIVDNVSFQISGYAYNPTRITGVFIDKSSKKIIYRFDTLVENPEASQENLTSYAVINGYTELSDTHIDTLKFSSLADFSDINLQTGDYTNDPFYFRANGNNCICMATLPEISVDDESYCFIKIKD